MIIPLQIDILLKERIEKGNYATNYRYMMANYQDNIFVKMFDIFGQAYRKPMYVVSHFITILLLSSLATFSYIRYYTIVKQTLLYSIQG